MKYRNSKAIICGFSVVGALFLAGSANGAAMEFVTIGDAGNTTNVNGYGRVDYSYQIGTKEVTIAQFQDALGSGTGAGEDYWSALVGPDAPAAQISFVEAAMYCNYLTTGSATSGAYGINGTQDRVISIMSRQDMLNDGGTFYVLPTADEWYKAAYYKDGAYSLYANGSLTDPGAANYNSTSPWTVGSGVLEQNGTYDMMGNVWEWTESAYDGSVDFPVEENLIFWGGAYDSPTTIKLRSDTVSYDLSTKSSLEQVGFRVAVIPEPGTISLMSISTLGLFTTRTLRRRKRVGMTLMPTLSNRGIDDFRRDSEVDGNAPVTEVDYLSLFVGAVIDGVDGARQNLRTSLAQMDKGFWNLVVASFDKCEQWGAAVRLKAGRTLDSMLARILK